MNNDVSIFRSYRFYLTTGNGKRWIIPDEFHSIKKFSDGSVIAAHSRKKGLLWLSAGGRIVELEDAENWFSDFSENRLVIKMKNGFRYMDRAGNLLGDSFDSLTDVKEGFGVAKKNKRFYYVNSDGEILFGPFLEARPFMSGAGAFLGIDEKWNAMNSNGEVLLKEGAIDVVSRDDSYPIFLAENGKKFSVDKDGNLIFGQFFGEGEKLWSYGKNVVAEKANGEKMIFSAIAGKTVCLGKGGELFRFCQGIVEKKAEGTRFFYENDIYFFEGERCELVDFSPSFKFFLVSRGNEMNVWKIGKGFLFDEWFDKIEKIGYDDCVLEMTKNGRWNYYLVSEERYLFSEWEGRIKISFWENGVGIAVDLATKKENAFVDGKFLFNKWKNKIFCKNYREVSRSAVNATLREQIENGAVIAAVSKNKKNYYRVSDGKKILKSDLDARQPFFSDGYALAWNERKFKYVVVDLEGNEWLEGSFVERQFALGVFMVRDDGKESWHWLSEGKRFDDKESFLLYGEMI